MRWMREKARLKVMQLKLRTLDRYRRLFFSIPGEVTQKGAGGASTAAENARRLAEEAVNRFDWKYAPRAKVAIRMHFSTQNKQPPELQNLVKFYLDPLKSVIFADDRQVSYLEAHYWRRSKDDVLILEPSTDIEVDRATNYNQRIKLYEDLLREPDFKDYLRYNLHDSDIRAIYDKEDDRGDDSPFDILRSYSLLLNVPGLTNDQRREIYEQFITLRDDGILDHEILKISKLHNFDQPRTIVRAMSRDIEVFTINLGNLPERGQSEAYKQRIRQQMVNLGIKYNLEDIRVPVELDVQVSAQGLRLGKDLDNIMRDIAPALRQQLLHGRSYLHGYRIYTISSKYGEDLVDGIRIKLLPPHAIYDFSSRIEKVLEAADAWIDTKL